MDESNALMRLLEAADLVGMVEELTARPRDELSPTARAGLRVTLKNVRESILKSHDALATGMVANASKAPREQAASAPKFERRDLRSTIEKFIEPAE